MGHIYYRKKKNIYIFLIRVPIVLESNQPADIFAASCVFVCLSIALVFELNLDVHVIL